MVEINRFMRWTLPGLVTLTQLFLVFLVSDTVDTLDFIKGISASKAIVAALASIAGSGAIGFIFALVYYGVVDWCPWLLPDYRPLFTPRNGETRLLKGGRMEGPHPNKSKAWLLQILYWHRLREEDNDIKGVKSIAFRLVDTMQSLGATIVGTLLAAMLWGFFQVRWSIIRREYPGMEEWLCAIIWAILIYLYCNGWLNVRRKLEIVMNSTMLSSLLWRSDAKRKSRVPNDIVYTEGLESDVERYSVCKCSEEPEAPSGDDK